jgi:hypothetical protein
MSTVALKHVDALRRGVDVDGVENPAGPLFADGYREYEITLTGPVHTGPETNLSWWEGEMCQACCWL